MKKSKSYGLWPSVINAQHLTAGNRRFGTLKVSEDKVYWAEQRADEAGRTTIMEWCPNKGYKELFSPSYSARSKVHEYGGGEFCAANNEIYFVNAEDQQIYQLNFNEQPNQITNAPDFRFADLEYDKHNHRLFAVAEYHRPDDKFPQNLLVTIGLSNDEKGGMAIISDDHDFYASPRLSPDGKQIAWLQWNLPNMPWQAAELVVSEVDDVPQSPIHIAGGENSASFQPTWSKRGELYFINDQSGYGQLYKWTRNDEQITKQSSRAGDALRPLWVFGMGSIAVDDENAILVSSFYEGMLQLERISETGSDLITHSLVSFDNPVALGKDIISISNTHHFPPTISLMQSGSYDVNVIRTSSDLDIDTAHISKGHLKRFTNSENEPVYGIYYPPTNADYSGRDGEQPPAILTIHGGPTGMADRGLKLKTQYWTNRGYAVFDIDYSGSSGYGLAYRQRLDGLWGVKDVEDVISAAHFLSDEGLADKEKMIITGGSAGGYTCLMALIKSDIFKCASCSYPVTDLGQLIEITHKFEAGYVYSLTGTTAENAKQKLEQSSVLNQVEHISSPVLFFQGLQDKVVPPSQPEAVYEALKAKGVETHLLKFDNEGHGFRNGETIEIVLQKEEEFFQKILGL